MPIQSGTHVGPYEIISAIRAGGMGEVYRAHDPKLGRDVAIKVLPSSFSSDPDRLRRFEQEARAAAALNHPNILAVHQMGTYEGAPYLVSELLEGSTLREQLGRGPMPLRKVIDYGVQIARGLAAAHDKGIVHRDLKPENLFVTKDGRLKILDFGLAKLTEPNWPLDSKAATVSRGTEPGVVMGTVGYMAPEQVSGKPVDHRADIFAFGAVLYEMLTGKRAFQKATSVETLSAILNEDPPGVSQVVPAIPPALQRVVGRCLEKDPEQRFRSASDLAFALEALSESSSVSAAGIARPASRRIRPWVAVLAALTVLALLAGGGLILFRSQEPTGPARLEYSQLTDFADSAVSPALSPDGRMLTFIRGADTFYGTGEIYVKILPNGEAVQLTHDRSMKMSPVFSPDGSTIAYTVREKAWETWVVPVLGGEARIMLPNAEGLTWIDAGHFLFSEIKTGIHMAVVNSTEMRSGSRDVYVPPRERGMAHRSAISPDHKWVLVAEMDNGGWLPCRVVPFDGSSPGRSVGPQGAGCTYVAWSPDGAWMYFSSDAGGRFHIWRQRFPDGPPQQVTSGAAEEEGIAVAPDGGSLITSSGLRESTLWVHDGRGEREISSEGYVQYPQFSADGKKLYYLVRRFGISAQFVSGELWVADLETARSERLLPSFLVTGYGISQDGEDVVFSATDAEGRSRLWLASLDLRSAPRQFPSSVNEDEPYWDAAGHIYFRAAEGSLNFVYRMNRDGSDRTKLHPDPMLELRAVSPDGQWAVVGRPQIGEGAHGIVAIPTSVGPEVTLCARYCELQWNSSGTVLSIFADWMEGTRTFQVPVVPGRNLPAFPPAGIETNADMEKIKGATLLDGSVIAGPTKGLSARMQGNVHRNLYRVALR